MARNTIKDYYNIIAAEANNNTELLALEPNPDSAQTFLSDINSPSVVDEHRLLIWLMAFLSWVVDTMQVQHEAEISTILSEGRYGTFPYYIKTSLSFQFGDTQSWVDDNYEYPGIDPLKQIIKYADANGAGKLVNIKVAKDNAGIPEKLSAAEKAAFESYFANWEAPGISYAFISMDSDLLKLELDVYYNPQLLDNTGVLISDGSLKPVEIALKDYLNAVKFNSRLELLHLIDSVQKAEGVIRPYTVSAYAKAYGGYYSLIDRSYSPVSGYIKIDPSNKVVINYIPNS